MKSLLSPTVEQMRVMGIAIDDDGGFIFFEHAKVFEIGEKTIAAHVGFRVNLNREVMIHNVLKQVNHQLVIPCLLVDSIAKHAGVVPYFIKMPNHLKASTVYHVH